MLTLSHSIRIAVAVAAVLVITACGTTSNTRPDSVAPTVGDGRAQAAAHTSLAMGYYERGQFDVALEELERAKNFDSNYAPIYNGYGLVYSYMNENDRARESFQTAIRLDPKNSEIRHNLGWFLCTSGLPLASLPEFDRVIADPFYPTPEIALTNAGRCALSAKNVNAARSYLQRALQAKPNYVPAAFTLADIMYRQNSLEEARAMMRIVMQNPQPNADALLLGACLERKMKNKRAEESYTSQLQNRFPNSPQAKKVLLKDGCK